MAMYSGVYPPQQQTPDAHLERRDEAPDDPRADELDCQRHYTQAMFQQALDAACREARKEGKVDFWGLAITTLSGDECDTFIRLDVNHLGAKDNVLTLAGHLETLAAKLRAEAKQNHG